MERHKTAFKGGARRELKQRQTVFSGATTGASKVMGREAPSKSKLKCK